MTDIVERLLNTPEKVLRPARPGRGQMVDYWVSNSHVQSAVMAEAAAEITRLRAELAAAAERADDDDDDDDALTVQDLPFDLQEALGYAPSARAETERRKAAEAKAEAPVRVKPLEWHEILTHGGEALCASFEGRDWRIYLRGLPLRDRDAIIAAKKAEAQAEFEACILSALVS